MSDTITTERPKPKRRKAITPALRRRIEEAVERMIDALDALDAPAEDTEPEDEGSDDEQEGDGDVDDEPSLGALEAVNQVTSWKGNCGSREDLEIDLGAPGLWEPRSQEFAFCTFGISDSREMDDDFEPSLGSTNSSEHHNGASIGTSDEREDEHDGREPSLGSLNWATERVVVGRDKQGRAVKEIFREGDQSRWASGSLNDVELDADHEEGGIEDEPHDEDTDQDGCPSQDGVPFMTGGDRRGDLVRIAEQAGAPVLAADLLRASIRRRMAEL